MKPLIVPKYDIGIIISNCNTDLLRALEPWCSDLYVDCDTTQYFSEENPNTFDNLANKLRHIDDHATNGVIVYIEGTRFTNDDFNLIQQMGVILSDSGEIGEFEIENLKLEIVNLEQIQNRNIYIEEYGKEKV